MAFEGKNVVYEKKRLQADEYETSLEAATMPSTPFLGGKQVKRFVDELVQIFNLRSSIGSEEQQPCTEEREYQLVLGGDGEMAIAINNKGKAATAGNSSNSSSSTDNQRADEGECRLLL